MDELRGRFAALERVPVPDLRSDIDRRVGGAAATTSAVKGQVVWRPGRPSYRLSPMAILLLLGLLLTLAFAVVAVGSRLPDLWTSVFPPPPSLLTERIEVGPQGGFVAAGSMTDSGCAWCHAVVLNDGRVLVVGSAIGQIYDPATWAFAPTELVSHGRPVLLEDGRVLLSGLPVRDGESPYVEIYDPATGASRAVENPFNVGAAAVGLADGRVLLLGTVNAGEGPGSAATFDPRTDTLSATGPTIAQRHSNAELVPLNDGRVLVVGGSADGRSAELYDPATDTFSATGSMSTWRGGFTATRLTDGRVLLVGGSSETETGASAEMYDPATETFTLTGSMDMPRFWHATALLPDGRVLVVGGATDGVRVDQGTFTEIYDPQTGQFTRGPVTQQPRVAATAVSLPQGVLVLGHYPGNIGGNDAASRTAELFTLAPVDRPIGCCFDTPGFVSVSATAQTAARQAALIVPAGALEGATRASAASEWSDANGGSGVGLFLPSCSEGCSIPISLSSISSIPSSAPLTITVDITYRGPPPPQAADIEIVFFGDDDSD